MNHPLLQNQEYFQKNTPLGIGYSFTRNTYVRYTLVYDDTRIFSYQKTSTGSDKSIQEEYFGSDSFEGMLALTDLVNTLNSGLPPEIIAKTRRGITKRDVIEIHYSYEYIDKNFTFYIYSKDIGTLEKVLGKDIYIPSFEYVAANMSMYCLKLKKQQSKSGYTSSIVFTSKNIPDGNAYVSLQNSHFFLGGFGDVILPDFTHIDVPFYTFEVAYNLTTCLVENFILFYTMRHKSNAKSTTF